MCRLSRDTESASVLQERHARLPNATLGVVASGTQPVAEAVYPSGERRPSTWDLKAALEFAKSAAGEFCVGPSGEHAFDRSKVEARLKKKGQEKTEKEGAQESRQILRSRLAMQLQIEVTFTSGCFHGEEWPPSPARLFQAMVAATHRGAYALFNPQVRDDALRWLESLEPPVICACPAIHSRQRLVNYVPNNDNILHHVRTDKSLTAYALPGSQAVMYRWSFPANANARHQADVVSAMAALITYLGRTVDHVYTRGTVRRDGQPPRRDGELLYKPMLEAGGRWLVPAPGFLDLCKRRYPRSVSEEPPDFTNSRQADYASEWAIQNEAPVALFAMRRDDRRLLAFDPRDVRQPVGMLRHALRRWVDENPSIQAHYGADRIARLLFGHRSASAAEPSEGGHFAVVPLPSLSSSQRGPRASQVL